MRNIFRLIILAPMLGCAGPQPAQRPPTGAAVQTPIVRERVPIAERNRYRDMVKNEHAYDGLTKVEGALAR